MAAQETTDMVPKDVGTIARCRHLPNHWFCAGPRSARWPIDTIVERDRYA